MNLKFKFGSHNLVAREGVSWDIRDKNALLIEYQFHRQKMWVMVSYTDSELHAANQLYTSNAGDNIRMQRLLPNYENPFVHADAASCDEIVADL